jgi:predicted nucleotidyltransferase
MDRIYSIEEIKELLYPVFNSHVVYKATLFGSYAKGKADKYSDLDIVVDCRGEVRGFEFFGLLGDLADVTGKKIDLIEKMEIKENSPVLSALRNEGVVLYERA